MSRAAAAARQGLSFLFVGGSAALLDFGVLSALVWLGGSPYAARILSIACSITYTYLLNRRVTFHTGSPPSLAEFVRYISVAISGVLANLAIYWAALYAGAPTWLAFCLGAGLVMVYSFLAYRRLLHRPKPTGAGSGGN